MRHIWIYFSFLLFQNAYAQVFTVTDVKVSASAESAATAREQALNQAHSLAFEKLMKEKFPETSRPFPPLDILVNMVIDFSIDREKTTPTSYAASLTFQFDGSQIYTWMQQGSQSVTSPSSLQHRQIESNILKITASYTMFSQWLHIKKVLTTLPEVQKVTVINISPLQAIIDIAYAGDREKLRQNLQQEGCLLSLQDGGWILSSIR